MVVLIATSLLIMATLDYVTGQELVFSCCYLIPVSLTAWYFRRHWMVLMSVVSCVTAFFVDEFDGYSYSNPGIQYWNAFTCFIISIVTGFILCRLKETLLERKRAYEELRAALKDLEASTSEIRKLQSGLQTVCAWTKQIQVGEQWMTPEEFLKTQLHLQLTHGISPDAFREMGRGLSTVA